MREAHLDGLGDVPPGVHEELQLGSRFREVHEPHVEREHAPRVRGRVHVGRARVADRDDHGLARRVADRPAPAFVAQGSAGFFVVLVDAQKAEQHHRNRDEDDPGALSELEDREDDRHEPAYDPAEPIDDEPALPFRFLQRPMPLRHPEL